MTREELHNRLKQFTLRVFRLVGALPRNVVANTIGGQVTRCSSSSAANYRAACRSRSAAEFSARLGVVLEELDESAFWLDLIIAAELLPKTRVALLLDEANELVAIFSRSYATSRRNAKRPKASREGTADDA
ncbi:four helix bundle protein [bacterium]|nr:four helix bundle protein [bacterium]